MKPHLTPSHLIIGIFSLLLHIVSAQNQGCRFFPIGENRRFERVEENLPVGHEVFRVEVHPRNEFRLEAVDNSLSDINYFRYEEINNSTVAIKLAQSLEDLVDKRDPQSVLKFKLTCRGPAGTEDAFLPITIYIQDVNDHKPEFQNVPYSVEVDELTPVGLTVFRGIHAIDRDKPNTANSDITYSIVGGNENNSFILSDPIEGILVVNKPLDYDHGIREFKIQIQASDHGSPSLSSITTITIKVKDSDDQNPVFTREVYKASVSESPIITGLRIREKVVVQPSIHAFDQDTGINARLRYNIILGNENGFFEMNEQTAELYLVKEIDLESLANAVITLSIQATQIDNQLRQALSRVEVTVIDINDNLPEFEYDMYNITVMENLPVGFTVLQVQAVDRDRGENAEFKYVINDETDTFQINENNGWISVKNSQKLDREAQAKFILHVSTVERNPNIALNDGGRQKRNTQCQVEVNLLDANDQNPQFYPSNHYSFNVLETAEEGTIVGSVFAHDKDLDLNGLVRYHKQVSSSNDEHVPFDVHFENGSIYVKKEFTALSRKARQYTLFVVAEDQAVHVHERRSAVAVVKINIDDINNSVPEFVGAPYQAYVGESLPEGSFVIQVQATDEDNTDDVLTYSIVAGNDEKLFVIDSLTGKIFTSAVLDYEKRPTYDLLVQVSDGINTAVTPLLVNVIDINDQIPTFMKSFYNFTVEEEDPDLNRTIGQVQAQDLDSGKNAQIKYKILDSYADEAFVIDANTGWIKPRRTFDREQESEISFKVQATDGGTPQLSSTCDVRVYIKDINDNSVVFPQSIYTVEIEEEKPAPLDVIKLQARDNDQAENAIIKYLILAGNEDDVFQINENTGLIRTKKKLNYEQKQEYIMHIAARNIRPFEGPNAELMINPAVQLIVRVIDINDELVVFDQQNYRFSVPENTALNTLIGQVNATNPKRSASEQDVIYWLEENQVSLQKNAPAAVDSSQQNRHQLMNTDEKRKFKINRSTGEIYLIGSLDRDYPANEQFFRLRVFSRDLSSINTFNTSATVEILVSDTNDNPPVFNNDHYTLELPESLPPGTMFPAFFKVSDLDEGDNGKIVRFQLQYLDNVNDTKSTLDELVNGESPLQNSDIFHINNATGSITLTGTLDFETKNKHELLLIAFDGGNPANIGQAKVSIQVRNVNEFPPRFLALPYLFYVQERAKVGTEVGRIIAVDDDFNKITFSISSAANNNHKSNGQPDDVEYFQIDESSGKITVREQLPERTEFVFVAKATDDGLPQNYSLGVQVVVKVQDQNDFPPAFTSENYEAEVLEKQETARTIIQVNAVDQDLQDNIVRYSIVSGNDEHIFTINEQSGEISILPGAGAKLDYDRKNQYVLLIKATDSSPTPLYSLAMVKILVRDTNNNAPFFQQKVYSASIAENLPANHCFLTAQANSGDSVDELTYSLASSHLQGQLGSANLANHNLNEELVSYGKNKKKKISNNVFSINERTGQICTKVPLDREQKANYEFLIAADDGKFRTVVPLTVQVLDENDSPPVFDQPKYQMTLPFDTQPGTELLQLSATDADLGANAELVYWIKNTHGLFEIDAKTGLVRLVSNLPQIGSNKNLTFEMEVFCQDHGLIPNIGKALLVVKVSATKNHPPKFERFSYTVEVDENLSNVVILQVQAHSSNPGSASKIVYKIVKSSLPDHFSIDRYSGMIKLDKPLDYEQTKFLELTVEAKEEGADAQFTTTVVQIRTRDSNDCAPEILAMPSVLRIPESTLPLNEIIYQVMAVDLDSSYNNNNLINYEFQNPSAFFVINRMTGQIFANQSLTPLSENLVIIVSDNGSPPLATVKEIKLIVYKDTIDQPTPIFSAAQYGYDLETAVEPGNVLLRVKAKIPNGNQVYYNISSDPTGQFIVDPASGAISVLTKLDPETVNNNNILNPYNKPSAMNNHLSRSQVFSFIVNAYNREDPYYSSESSVTVRIVDSTVRCPKFPFSQYYATIEENSPPNTIVLQDLMIEDYRRFEKQQLTYQITEDNSNDNFFIDVFNEKFSTNQNGSAYVNLINASANKMSVSLKIKKAIDRDTMSRFLHGVYTLVVSASNVKCSTRTMIKVLVEDANDNNPVFTEQNYFVQLRENTQANTVVTRVNATDKDQLDHNKLRYYIVDGNERQMFTMNENSGVISLLAVPDREQMNYYQLRLVAIDTANNTGFATLNVEILDENDHSPTFLNSTFTMNVTEGPSSVGTRIRLPVYDLDEGVNANMEVYIVDGNSNGEFRLDVDEGGPMLTVIAELDREKYASNPFMNNGLQASLFGRHGSYALHQVFIAAKDKGVPPRVGKAQVNVIISDINDTPPRFERDSYIEFLQEDIKPGAVVCEIKASDDDSTEKTQLSYAFGKGTGNNIPFKIDPITGTVNVSRPLDISEAEQYQLVVEVFDGLWKSSANLKIFINEAEERNPKFGQTYWHFNVLENEQNAFVGRVELKPRKSRVNSLMQYVIVNVEMRNLFAIDANGEITTKKPLDREKRSQYSFTVMLEEKRPSTKITIAEVIINVLDVNDETPSFSHSYKGTIKENSAPGTQVQLKPANIHAVDNDAGNNSIVHYTLSGEGADYFTVLDSGSVIYTPKSEQQVLDREAKAKFDLTVTATDTGNLSSTTALVIELDDQNDNSPVFQHGPLFILIPEIAKPGSKIGNVYATDADEGLNSKIQYYITSGSNGDIKIDRVSGELFVVGNLVPNNNYLLNISAVDGGGLASRVNVNISIVDINDHRPVFDQSFHNLEVLEGNYTNDRLKLGVLRARDEDYGKNALLEYSIASGVPVEFPFTVDVHTGELFASGFIDREHKDLYKFQVIAIDNGDPPLNSTTDVIIRIKDANDNRPRFYTDPYLAHVPENMEAGYKVTQIAAFDSDLGENGQVFYKLGEGHDNKFYIDGKDGTVSTLGPLDFEKKSFYNITVIAYDKGQNSLSSSAKLWVTVSDMPDDVPDFPKAAYTIEIAESALIDQTIYTMDAGVGAKRYILVAEENRVLENNPDLQKQATFSIDRSSGEIKLKKPLDSTQKNHYKLIVRAEDESDPPKSDSAELNVFIGTGQGVRLFSERIYKVAIYENQLAPSLLIDLNSTNEIIHRPVYYSLIGTNYDDLFKVEHDTGRLLVTRSLDREQKSSYKLKVRENYANERHKRAVNEKYEKNERYVNNFNEHLSFDEALIVVEVLDENDSIPKFVNGNAPIVAAVPLEASFGYIVCKVTATDKDIAENSMIKYEMIAKNDDSSSKFYVDPTTGNIRSIVSFAMDANKYYHFEVKATDRNGDPNGNSALVSVYIYVLPETKMVLFVTDAEPVRIENRRDEILSYLSRLTKYEVKLAKITPHLEQGVQQYHSTDMYLYAVNPRSNEIVEIDQLLNIFRESSHQILDQLKEYRIRRIQGVTVHEKISQMGTTEIAIIGLSTVIFLGTIIAILLLCSSCKERKLRKEQMHYEHQRLFQAKNAFLDKQPAPNNLYGARDLSNGNSNCTYSTEDGNGSEYFNNLAQYKRNDLIAKGRQIPPDGASSLNQSRSPRFSDRYKHRFGGSGQIVNPPQGEWFDQPKEPVPSIMSRHSRASGRSAKSQYSGTSWSVSEEERNFATEL